MSQALYILMAIGVGVGSAFQTGMIASLGRARGPVEAAWISILASVAGLALFLSVRTLRGNAPSLPAPMNGVPFYLAVLLIAGVTLVLAMRDLDFYLAVTGLFGVIYIASAAFLAPKIGIALFASAITAGTLFSSLGLDHVGAFGADIRAVNLIRIMGVALLFLGVVLVRVADR